MKRIYGFLVVLMAIFCMPFMTACDEEIPVNEWITVVEIDEQDLEMAVGTTYQLNYNVLPSEASESNKKVTFTSSNENCVKVTNDGVVTAVAQTVTAVTIKIASVQNKNAVTDTCHVIIVGQTESLTTPKNLKFDTTQNCLTWDAVTVSNNSYAVKYEVKLTDSNGTETIKTTNTNKFDGFSYGTMYSVQVRALGNTIRYTNSAYTSVFNFCKLSAPTNIKISNSDIGGLGNWISKDNPTSTVSNALETRISKLTFDIPANMSVNNGNIGDNFEIKVYQNKNKKVLGVTDQGYWNTAINNAVIENNKVVVVVPSDISSGNYYISVKAKGNSVMNTYDANISDMISFTKLKSPTNMVITGQKFDYLTWDNYNETTKYRVVFKYKLNGQAASDYCYKFDYVTGNSYTIPDGLLNVGNMYTEFYIYMFAIGDEGDNATKVDSVISSEYARNQLGQVTGVTLNNRGPNDNIVVSWDAVQNATLYKVEIINSNDKTYAFTTSDLSYTFTINQVNSLNEEIWTETENNKNNYITVQAYPDINSNSVEGLKSSSIELIKLATPSMRIEGGKLCWNAVNSSVAYSLKINDTPYNNAITDTFVEITGYSDVETDTEISVELQAIGPNNAKNIINSGIATKVSNTTYGKIVVLKKPGNITVSNGEVVIPGNSSIYYLKIKENDNIREFSGDNNYLTGLCNADNANCQLRAGHTYELSIREYGANQHLSGDYSSVTYVHMVNTIRSLFLNNGELSWNAVDDDILWQSNNDTLYSNNVSNVNYEITPSYNNISYTPNSLISAVQEVNSVYTAINSLSYVFDNLPSNYHYTFYIKTKVNGVYKTSTDGPIYCLNSPKIKNTITYKQLNKVDNLTINNEYQLSWTTNETNATSCKYLVNIFKDGTVVNSYELMNPEVNSNSFTYNNDRFYYTIGEGSFANDGAYVVTVVAQRSGCLNSYAESVSITRIQTPQNVRIDEGKLKWGSVDTNCCGYNVYYNNDSTWVKQNNDSIITSTEYDLTFLNAGTVSANKISVVAIATGNNYLNSKRAVLNNATIKLPEVSGLKIESDSAVSDAITWTKVSSNGILCTKYFAELYLQNGNNYELYETKTIEDTSTNDTIDYDLGGYVGGNYRIVITALASGMDDNSNIYINSNASFMFDVVKLHIVNGVGLSSDGNNLVWQGITDPAGVNGVIKYAIIVFYAKDNSSNSYIYGNDYTSAYMVDDNNNGSVALSSLYQVSDSSGGHYIAPGSSIMFGVYAVYQRNSIDTVYIARGSNSITYNATILSAPGISCSNGILSWENDIRCKEVILSFYAVTGDTVAKSASYSGVFSKNTTTFDMNASGLSSNIMYVIRAQSVGNNVNSLSSNIVQCSSLCCKLANIIPNSLTTYTGDIQNITNTDINGWYVEKGKITWFGVDGATSYNVVTYDMNGKQLIENCGVATKCSFVPSCSSGSGQKLQIQVIGGVTDNVYYVTSTLSDWGNVKKTFSKYTKVTGIKVTDGEIVWNRNAYANIGLTPSFAVKNTSTNTMSASVSYNTDYIMSQDDNYSSEGAYTISVYAIGNDWIHGDGSIYINSEESRSFTVQKYNISDFNVNNGELVWDQEAINHTRLDYDLLFDIQSGNNTTTSIIVLNKKMSALSDYENTIFNQIDVRIRGARNSVSSSIPVVNSAYFSINNIIKLPNLSDISISEYGEVAWNYNNYIGNSSTDISEYISSSNLKTTIGINLTNSQTGNQYSSCTISNGISYDNGSATYYVIASALNEDKYAGTYALKYNFSIYVNGENNSGTYKFINSNASTYSTYRLNQFSTDNFKTDEDELADIFGGFSSLNIMWNLNDTKILCYDNGQVNDIKGNRILLEYKKSSESWWTRQWIDGDIENIAQFFAGSSELYLLRISAMSMTDDLVTLRSNSITITDKRFDLFTSGTGAINNPFVVTNSSLKYIYYMPNSYFEMNSDITLTSLGENVNGTNLPSNAGCTFGGGLNGNGHSITNIQFRNANCDFALFDKVASGVIVVDTYVVGAIPCSRNWLSLENDGTALTPTNNKMYLVKTSGDYQNHLYRWDGEKYEDVTYKKNTTINNDFYNKSGIVKGVNIELKEMTIDCSSANCFGNVNYNGFIANENYGYIINCNTGITDIPGGNGGYTPVITLTNINRITDSKNIGMIVGYNGYDTYLLQSGVVQDCTNAITWSYAFDSEGEVNGTSCLFKIGGIAECNVGGCIINCVNGSTSGNNYHKGNLIGNNVGGIVCENLSYTITSKDSNNNDITTVISRSIVTGCMNIGAITCIAKYTNVVFKGGGICAGNTEGVISYCINRGTVTYSIKYNNVSYQNNELQIGHTKYPGCLGGILGCFDSIGSYVVKCCNLSEVQISDSESVEDECGFGAIVGYNGSNNSTNNTLVQYCVFHTNSVKIGSNYYNGSRPVGSKDVNDAYLYNCSDTYSINTIDDTTHLYDNTTLLSFLNDANTNSVIINGTLTNILYTNINGVTPSYSIDSNNLVIQYTNSTT